MNVRRIAVITIFDTEGHLDKYAEYLIFRTLEICNRLIVVSNHKLDSESKSVILKYTDELYERENIGFDAGAYKDVITRYVGIREICKYDELVLLNDTYYGPFDSWKTVFDVMASQDVDFWGITKIYGSLLDEQYEKDRIQSYFLVFGEKIIKSRVFMNYWNDLQYPATYKDAVIEFEIGIYECLKDGGFKDCVYVEAMGCGVREGVNIYRDNPYALVSKYECPIIRRKNLYGATANYRNALKALEYVDRNTQYDMSFIKDNIERLEKNGTTKWFERERTLDFCRKHSSIYIYGHGKVAEQVARYLNDLGLSFAGYIVKEKKLGEDVLQYDQVKLSNTMGVIIGVGAKYFDEVYDMLRKDMPQDRILCVKNCNIQ